MMGMITPAAYRSLQQAAPEHTGRAEAAAQAKQMEKEAGSAPQGGPPAPDVDEYIRSEGDSGNRKRADLPNKAPDGTESKERCTANTDKVDAEIRKLKEKKENIQQQLAKAADHPEQREKLEKQLQQIENELKMKDNDSYRRRHTEYTCS